MHQTVNIGDYLEESLDFIRRSLDDYTRKAYKFSVLHAAMALEMLMKERLVTINPGLILSDIDRPSCQTTVGMNKLIPRFASLGIPLDDADKRIIEKVTDWRNDVAHRKLIASEKEVVEILPSIFKYFQKSLCDDLKIDIETKLTDEEFLKFRELLLEWNEIVRRAHGKAFESGDTGDGSTYEVHNCPNCWTNLDTVAIRNGVPHCFLCDEDFMFIECSRCGGEILADSEPVDGFKLCDDCKNYYEWQD